MPSATCIQRSDDSRNSAIRIAYRISLRSSSIWEPRYPSLKIFYIFFFFVNLQIKNNLICKIKKVYKYTIEVVVIIISTATTTII